MNNTTITISGFSYSFDEMRNVLTDSRGREIIADVKKISEGEFSVLIDGKSIHLFLSRSKHLSTATVNNYIFEIQRETMREKLEKQLQKDSGTKTSAVTVRAPMPGLITKMLIQEGSHINAGDGILVVEAMKMENEIKSPMTGILKKIFVKEKQTVEKNDNLFTIE